MKYIAYGSNMSAKQMAHRCPGAELIGVGRLLCARLDFYTHATVETVLSGDARVPVAVWEITEQDEANLDYYEGVPTYYVKRDCPVFMDNGETLDGMIYLMNTKRRSLPSRSYYDGIRQAYIDLGLSSEIKTVLEPALRRAYERVEGNRALQRA